MTSKTPNGSPRGCPEHMWHNWDTEYAGDLYSLLGNIHQASTTFSLQSRGKQTLCNIVMAIGMIQIYDLKAWSAAVVDSVLVNGDNYCRECIKDIKEENYELSIDDLKTECEIFPYTFKIKISNVVDGTMFLLRSKSFNLFKALRYFFDDYDRRFGIITVSKYNGKRQLGFGKTRDLEYFMFDCESVGVPMFPDGQAVAYILRTTTFNRLLHVLTLTLRGGDFFIFEVKTTQLVPMK
ncbi:hypothetical protein WA026_015869 [Henosepilachna vigintioctopunctata]|uniref:Uncharacterized protein n=1 Tax=Henosepilachna vigintioctopunctata TaxID=420089 RepID=A0AAW1V242_9CUCU